jgi:hypothetical protein
MVDAISNNTYENLAKQNQASIFLMATALRAVLRKK